MVPNPSHKTLLTRNLTLLRTSFRRRKNPRDTSYKCTTPRRSERRAVVSLVLVLVNDCRSDVSPVTILILGTGSHNIRTSTGTQFYHEMVSPWEKGTYHIGEQRRASPHSVARAFAVRTQYRETRESSWPTFDN